MSYRYISYWPTDPRSKPPPGAVLDREHPLGIGLLSFPSFVEGAGSVVWDPVLGDIWKRPSTGFGTVTWNPRTGGLDFTNTSSTGIRIVAPSARIINATPSTMAILATPTNYGGTYGLQWGAAGAGGQGLVLKFTGATSLATLVVGSTDQTITVPSMTGIKQLYHMSCLGVNQTVYIGGQPVGITTASLAPLGAITQLQIFGNGANNFTSLQGNLDGAWFWTRVLSDLQVAWHAAEPYGMFVLPIRRSYSISSGGTPATVNAGCPAASAASIAAAIAFGMTIFAGTPNANALSIAAVISSGQLINAGCPNANAGSFATTTSVGWTVNAGCPNANAGSFSCVASTGTVVQAICPTATASSQQASVFYGTTVNASCPTASARSWSASLPIGITVNAKTSNASAISYSVTATVQTTGHTLQIVSFGSNRNGVSIGGYTRMPNLGGGKG